MPLSFEPNLGQADPSAEFVARGAGYTLLLGPTAAALRVRSSQRNSHLAWTLLNANPKARSRPADPLPGRTNYLIGNNPADWKTGIPNYSRVRYSEVYPGVDLVYYANQRRLEYDFIVSPGADPAAIQLEFGGVRELTIETGGDLLLRTETGKLRFKRPIAYQETGGTRRLVTASYKLLDRRSVAFSVRPYRKDLPLVIDPVLLYSTFFGGSRDDQPGSMAIDSTGNIYLGGSTASTNFRVTNGVAQGTNAGGDTDGFVVKLNPDASSVIFSTYLGGNSADAINGLAVDRSGNVYVTGVTSSLNFPVNTGSFNTFYRGNSDAFVAKLNPQGSGLVFSGFLGGSRFDSASSIALDADGSVYVTGQTNSNDFPTTNGAFQSVRFGFDLDVFVTKINPAGSGLLYSTFLAASGDEAGNAIAVDSQNTAFVVGITNSFNFPVTRGAFQLTCGRNTDAFVTRVNASGSGLVYSSCLGGTSDDGANAIFLDSASNAFVAGTTSSSNFVTSATAYQKNCGRGRDAFLTKWTPDGTNLYYSTCLGGGSDDSGFGVTADTAGNAYLTGQTASGDFPVTPDAIQSTKGSDIDAFAAKLDPNGATLLSSTFLGGGGADRGVAIALDLSGNGFVFGSTASNDFVTTAGALQGSRSGGVDLFLTRLDFTFNPAVNPDGIVNGATFAAGAVGTGSIASIFGVDLAVGTSFATSVPLPTTLGGTQVTVNDQPVPLFFVSPTQINFQLPTLSAGTVNAVVKISSYSTAPRSFTVAAAAPAIFRQGDTNRALAQNQDLSLNGPSSPAAAGSVIVVYLTGIGPVDNPVAPGAPTPNSPLARPLLPVAATIGGQAVDIQFIGLTPGFAGLAQANLRVPTLSAGDYPLVITIGSTPSNPATISVR